MMADHEHLKTTSMSHILQHNMASLRNILRQLLHSKRDKLSSKHKTDNLPTSPLPPQSSVSYDSVSLTDNDNPNQLKTNSYGKTSPAISGAVAVTKRYEEVMKAISGQTVNFPGFSKFYLPWSPKVNVHVDVARAMVEKWLDENCQDHAQKIPKFKAADFGLLCALMYPIATLEQLLTITRWFAWIFVQDDEIDEVSGDRAGSSELQTMYRDQACAFMRYHLGLDAEDPGLAGNPSGSDAVVGSERDGHATSAENELESHTPAESNTNDRVVLGQLSEHQSNKHLINMQENLPSDRAKQDPKPSLEVVASETNSDISIRPPGPALACHSDYPEPKATSKIMASFAEIGAHLRADLTRKQCQLFYDEFRTFQDWTLREQEYKLSGRIPTVEEYWTLRMGTIGGGIGLSCIEFACGIKADRNIFQDPLVVAFWQGICRLLALCNDLFSLGKELGAGSSGLINIVPVYFVDQGCISVQKAVDTCFALIDGASEYFEKTCKDFIEDPINPLNISMEDKKTLVEQFRVNWVSHIPWCNSTKRYKVGTFIPGPDGFVWQT